VVSLPLYRAQRRRATIAAQAAARRRTVICLLLCLLGLIAGAVTLEREIHLQRVEVSR
jgi:cation transporter-like permease